MVAMSKEIVCAVPTDTRVPCTCESLNKGDHFEVAEPRVVIYLMPRMKA